jgi:hypothetical protein
VTRVISPINLHDWPSVLWRNVLNNRAEEIRPDQSDKNDRQKESHYNGVTDLLRC